MVMVAWVECMPHPLTVVGGVTNARIGSWQVVIMTKKMTDSRLYCVRSSVLFHVPVEKVGGDTRATMLVRDNSVLC